MGARAFESKLPQLEVISRDQAPESYAELDRILQRLLDTGWLKHGEDFHWEVVLHEDESGARSYPAGKILLSAGEIRQAPDEDALAALLAHEMVHSDRRHGARALTFMVGALGVGMRATSGWFGPLPGVVRLATRWWMVQKVAQMVERHAYSKPSELEADLLGVELACAAGYRGASLADMFTTSKYEPTWFENSHPSDERRRKKIAEHAEEIGCTDALSEDENFAALLAGLPAAPETGP